MTLDGFRHHVKNIRHLGKGIDTECGKLVELLIVPPKDCRHALATYKYEHDITLRDRSKGCKEVITADALKKDVVKLVELVEKDHDGAATAGTSQVIEKRRNACEVFEDAALR